MDYVNDTFTDTDGTDLATHAPDLGGPWRVIQGAFAIAGGQLLPVASPPHLLALAVIEGGHGNGRVAVDYTMPDSQEPAVVVFRWADDHNYWYARMTVAGMDLHRVFNGVTTNKGYVNDTHGVGVTKRGVVVITGDFITIGHEGGAEKSVNDAFNQTATVVGLGCAGYDRAGGLDDFVYSDGAP